MIPKLPHRAAVAWYLGVVGPLIGSLLTDPAGWGATLGPEIVYVAGSAVFAMQGWVVYSLYHADADPVVVGSLLAQCVMIWSEIRASGGA